MTRGDWDELAAGVFRRRWESLDLNVGLVLGSEAALVVDTRASHVEAQELIEAVRRVTQMPIRWVVDTHWHWDHTFGNAMFDEATIIGHTECRRVLAERGEAARAELLASAGEARRSEVEEIEIRLPDQTFERDHEIDIGGRSVSLSHHGRGHTEGDLVVTLSDAPVLFAGDLLEESAPPWFGDGYPIAWPATVEAVAELPAEAVVPGHGDVMATADVVTQLEELRCIAGLARSAHAAGIPADEVNLAGAPYPASTMREALVRAYLELG